MKFEDGNEVQSWEWSWKCKWSFKMVILFKSINKV